MRSNVVFSNNQCGCAEAKTSVISKFKEMDIKLNLKN